MNLTDYLAIYAAVLSTFVFLWTVSRARSRIRVKLLPGTNGYGEDCEFGAFVSVQNVSAHTVHLSSLSILYPYTKTRLRDWISHFVRYRRLPTSVGWVHTSLRHYGTEDGFPVSLEARKSIDVFIPDQVLQDMMGDADRREIRASVQDALWRNTLSTKMKIDWSVPDQEHGDGQNHA